MEPTKTLYERIQAISQEVRNVEKDMVVGTGSNAYKAVSDLQVTLAVKDAEQRHGIVSIPIRQELLSQESIKSLPDQYGKVKVSYADTVKMTTRLFKVEATTSGIVPVEFVDFIDVETIARGVDQSDKSFGKASTYARKYALLNAYKIATGEDPDAEKSTESAGAVSPSDKRIAVVNFLAKDKATHDAVCKRFTVLDTDELNDDQIGTIYNGYHSKGQL